MRVGGGDGWDGWEWWGAGEWRQLYLNTNKKKSEKNLTYLLRPFHINVLISLCSLVVFNLMAVLECIDPDPYHLHTFAIANNAIIYSV